MWSDSQEAARHVAITCSAVAAVVAAPQAVVVAAAVAVAHAARRHHTMVAAHDEGLEELLSHPSSRPKKDPKSHSTVKIHTIGIFNYLSYYNCIILQYF